MRLELHDNGVGCTADRFVDLRPGHLGVRTMQERANELGGWCRFDSTPGEGTTVTVWLPDDAQEAEGDRPAARQS